MANAPKAAHLRLIDGTRSRSKTLPKPEHAAVGTGRPVPPPGLDGAALDIWYRLWPILDFLTEADSYKLARYCRWEADPRQDSWPTSKAAEHRKCGDSLGMDSATRTRIPTSAAGPRRATSAAPETEDERLDREGEAWFREHAPDA